MKCPLCALGLCVIVAGATVAGEPQKKPKKSRLSSTPAAASPQHHSVSGRKELEALLATSAKLDFGDRKQVTVGEILDRLHEQHHLSLRFDAPTLASMFGTQPTGPQRYASPAVANSFRPICVNGSCSPAAPSYYAPGFPTYDPAGNPPRALDQFAQANPPAAAAVAAPTTARAQAAAAAPASATPPSARPATAPAAASVYADPVAGPATTPAATGPKVAPAAASPKVVNGTGPTPPAVSLPAGDPGLPPPASGPLPIPTPPAAPAPLPTSESTPGIQQILEQLLKIEIDVQNLDLAGVSIATVLRHALDAAPIAGIEDLGGMPILFTNAMLLDYLIEDHGLLITTRMKALTSKETRVYSVQNLQDLPPEQLAKTIRLSIRPWSWRSQINDLGDQLKGAPLPTEMLTSIVKTGVQLAGAEVGVSVTPGSVGEGASEATKSSADEARQMEMLGKAISNGLVTLAQATLSALEMVHYAEPPTGTIQTLGSKLVITQSQTAHREIAELLKQLAEE